MELRRRLLTAATRRDVRLLGLVVAVELLVLALYFVGTGWSVTRPRYVLYPFVWMNAAVWAVFHTDAPYGSRRRRAIAGTVALAYLFVLLWLAGLVGPALPGATDELVDVTVAFASPGWERVTLAVADASVTLIPYRIVGYLALSYLVYVTVADAATAAVSGALGLVSCVGCTFPILVSLASGVFGGSSAVVSTLLTNSVDISTAVFLLALAMLYYRPGFGAGTAGQRME